MDNDGDLDAVYGNVDQPNMVYLNTGGVLSASASWSSNTAGRTYGVALGDVDGDGDLDLAFVNSGDLGAPGESNELFLNRSDPLSKTLSWSSLPARTSRAVAGGDADGDGDPDVVFGNDGEASALYRNDEGVLGGEPAWSSSETSRTYGVALGDVDGDGLPDLACGSLDEPSALFLGDGDGFADSTAWESETAAPTWSVALGDVDGDGDLDLACGNLGESNTLFRNDGGVLSRAPAWLSSDTQSTRSVALADVDGDGDLDLACGNGGLGGEKNALYRNDGGSLTEAPVWLSGPANRTWGIAFGDVDGDGDPDLASANSDQNNTLYLNESGALSTSPAWTSVPAGPTRSIAFGDVDGDGDLDIVCGNYNQGTAVYLNDRGTVATTPAWSSPASTTGGIALADIDGDGDLDLVSANYARSNTLHPGARNPVLRGDLESPSGHLPNNDAFLTRASAERTGENLYRITLEAADVESDPVLLLAEYRYLGSWASYPLQIGAGPGAIGPLATSPAGVVHEFDWDVQRLPFDDRAILLRFRTIENPRTVPLVRRVPSFDLDIGPVLPTRAKLAASSRALVFPTVTTGDTVSTGFSIANVGNAALLVSGATLPSSEMRLVPAPPYALGEGESLDVAVFLEPVADLLASGALLLASNDPVTPVESIAVAADIRPLAVTSRLLTPGIVSEVRLGEALTVIVTPAPEVRVEEGTLHYTIPGAGGGSFSIPLSPSQLDFIAVIPGQHVTEAGLSYYVEVKNLPVVATDPPGAPADSVITVLAEAPDSLSSTSLPNSGEGYLEGREIRVLLNLQAGAVFESGTLHVRRGGERTYRSIDVDAGAPFPAATVPESLVGAAGLEYWLEVNTLSKTLTDPRIDPARLPHPLTVTVQNLAEDSTSAGSRYRMVSVPLAFSLDFTGTLEALLSDQQEFGPYDPVQWRAFRYVPDSLFYAELSDEWAAGLFRPEPGRAFWLIS
ncbi:MAG: FG-GAP-like repeat-containing protein, partial [Candidatus Eisenbacteria bacterium]